MDIYVWTFTNVYVHIHLVYGHTFSIWRVIKVLTGTSDANHIFYCFFFISDFTVNAMDVEELRRSQRRHRKARPERPTDIPLVSVSGSQDSDDDDEV